MTPFDLYVVRPLAFVGLVSIAGLIVAWHSMRDITRYLRP